MDSRNGLKDSNAEESIELEPSICKIKEFLPTERVTRKKYRKAKKNAIRKINRQSSAILETHKSSNLISEEINQEEIRFEYEKRKALWEEREKHFIQKIEKRILHENALKSQLEKSLGKSSFNSSGNLESISLVHEDPKNCASKDYILKKITEVKVHIPSLLKEKEPCIMFSKTGACRLGPACLWQHIDVSNPTSTLIFPHMFQFSNFDSDTTLSGPSASLKPQETTITTTLLSVFYDFFYDILPELSFHGSPIDIKVIPILYSE